MNSQQKDHYLQQNNPNRSPNSLQKWGSPAPSTNVRFSPYQNQPQGSGPRFVDKSPRHRQYSPRFNGHQNGNFCFRTPQPMQHHSSPQGRSWTGGDYNKQHYNRPPNGNTSPIKRFHNFKNHRFDPNCNPGGSNDIDQYYHVSMLQDPWQFIKPCPVNQFPPQTT